uniref:Heat shock protein 67B2-like n=1 Tax=Spodoptera frugiperda TaxID=7108 RepID=A0A5Q0TYX7_SPOFR|nr:heat shock protein 67B2-like [Spodoptera frugiperda]
MFSRAIRRSLPSSIQIRRTAGTTNLRKYITTLHVRHAPPVTHIPIIDNSVRSYSVQVNLDELTADYDYVKKATKNTGILIVDVREPDEVKEHGKIPNSVNIPLGNVSTVLGTMPEKDFQDTYQRAKPAENTEIIFYCMIGKRSAKAQQNAINLGYKNTKNYLGSWNDWASKMQ